MQGVITQVFPAQQGVSQKTGNAWVLQEYLLCHEQGQYPKYVCFRVFGQEKIQQLNIQLNEQLTVHLNVDARQGSRGGYFNSLDCWKVERATNGVPPPQGNQAVQQPAAVPAASAPAPAGSSDDLPF